MNEFIEAKVALQWQQPKAAYDVVIVGGGGHGLATAYYLATRHGITNVGVFERSYIGGGNSGRNTTVIRANYGIPEAVRFYQRSLELFASLEDETDRWIMHNQKGLLWMTHTEHGMRAEKARAAVNTAFGAKTRYVEPEEIKEICPQIDLSGGGKFPVLGASYHEEGATARHDRVVWALAEGAMHRGVHVHQRAPVTGLLRDGDRVTGIETPDGPVSAGVVVSAVGGHVTTLASMAGLRLPIRSHPLQAFVTNHYAQAFDAIAASTDLLFYMSQTARGEMLLGAEIDRQPSYSYRSGHHFLESCAHRAMTLFPFLRDLRILRQWTGICDMSPDYSPIMGKTGVDGFLVTTGWGTWGFKAIPVGGEQMAQLIATDKTPELIAPFSLDRFARDRTLADRGSAGTH
ncbi:MAG: FAD-dependent oxidoreductase [Acidimicrobiia bacterium]|nr:FAD-dependent oxidoreductase [Acidimicrobiia bacterium]NNF64345.1 FAD-dependent oxidoreductase [Acidimicrobiia bacterium]